MVQEPRAPRSTSRPLCSARLYTDSRPLDMLQIATLLRITALLLRITLLRRVPLRFARLWVGVVDLANMVSELLPRVRELPLLGAATTLRVFALALLHCSLRQTLEGGTLGVVAIQCDAIAVGQGEALALLHRAPWTAALAPQGWASAYGGQRGGAVGQA